jgi:hypothetical protein
VQSLEQRIEVREVSLEWKVVPISFENAAVPTADENVRSGFPTRRFCIRRWISPSASRTGRPALAADDSPREQERNPGVPVDGVIEATSRCRPRNRAREPLGDSFADAVLEAAVTAEPVREVPRAVDDVLGRLASGSVRGPQ